MKRLRTFTPLLLTFSLTAAALTPWAAAAGGPRLVTAAQAASSQTVGFDRLPDGCQSLQATFALSAGGDYDFLADQTLTALPGVYATFRQSGAAVTVYVTASFVLQGSDPALPFRDVEQDTWYYSGVEYAYAHGLMSGTGEGTFSPHLDTSRGMLVTILYRLAGSPAVGTEAAFSDVSQGDWYADGVAWASAHGVVSGYPGGLFGPNDPITREQMVAILYQFARLQGQLDSGRADLSRYTDADTLSPYAREPMSWAVAQGFISGLSADTLGPLASTTRAQAAVILTAFAKAVG